MIIANIIQVTWMSDHHRNDSSRVIIRKWFFSSHSGAGSCTDPATTSPSSPISAWVSQKTTINNFVVLGKKSVSIDESDRWCSPGPSVAGAGRGGGEQNQYEQISPLTKCCQVRIWRGEKCTNYGGRSEYSPSTPGSSYLYSRYCNKSKSHLYSGIM